MYRVALESGGKHLELTNHRHFVLSSTEGLGSKATVNISDYGAGDGGQVNSVNLQKRYITFRLRISRNGHGQEVREELESIIRPKRAVTVYIRTNARNVKIVGYHEDLNFDNPAAPYITLVCPNPWFTDVSAERALLFGTNPMFYFTKEGVELNRVIFSNTSTVNTVTVDYNGDDNTGAVYIVKLKTACSSFRIDNLTTKQYVKLSGKFLAGDVITISSVENCKDITILRGREIINGLKFMQSGSKLFSLQIGKNILRFTGEGLTVSGADVFMTYDIKVGAV